MHQRLKSLVWMKALVSAIEFACVDESGAIAMDIAYMGDEHSMLFFCVHPHQDEHTPIYRCAHRSIKMKPQLSLELSSSDPSKSGSIATPQSSSIFALTHPKVVERSFVTLPTILKFHSSEGSSDSTTIV